MRRFTKEELAQYNGRGGAPAYIACQGKVYDVSSSWPWRGGRHWAQHPAGVDLTAALAQAPRSADLMERAELIGVLID